MRSLSMLLLGASAVLGAAPLTAQPPAAGANVRADAPAGPQAGAHGGYGRRGQGVGRAALRGITLTDAQRAQLRTVTERYRTQHQALREQARGLGRPGQAAPGAARPDSAVRAAFQARVRDLRQRQLADVRAVLTPAQQATFDRNVAGLRPRAASHPRGAGREGRGRPGAGGMR